MMVIVVGCYGSHFDEEQSDYCYINWCLVTRRRKGVLQLLVPRKYSIWLVACSHVSLRE